MIEKHDKWRDDRYMIKHDKWRDDRYIIKHDRYMIKGDLEVTCVIQNYVFHHIIQHYLLSSGTTAKGTGLAESAGKEELVLLLPRWGMNLLRICQVRSSPLLTSFGRITLSAL